MDKMRFIVIPLFVLWLMGGCVSIGQPSCNNYAGTWELVANVDDSNCSGVGQRFKQVFVVNQNQCQLTIDGGIQGDIKGQGITWSLPSGQANGGTITYSSALAEIDNQVINGAYHWQWSDANYRCSGTTSVAGRILSDQEAAKAELGEFAMQIKHPMLSPSENSQAHTFSITAKGAKQVYLAGEMSDWRPNVFAMQPDENGLWSITLYLAPGAWQYKFIVDGTWIADQNNSHSVPDSHGGVNSVLLIGEEDLLLKADSAVAHGNIIEADLASKHLAQTSAYALYLPPNYHTSKQDYPLLVLLHGYGNNYKQWIIDGKIQHLMDNMIANKSIEPFIVLMPSAGTSYYKGQHESFIMQELLPHVAEQYQVKAGPGYSAISGISMGGAGAFYLAHKYPKQFGLSLPLSGYFDMEMYPSFSWQNFTLDAELTLFCGEDDSISYPSNRRLVEQLNQQGVEFSYLTAEGGHTWRYWNGISEQVLKQVSSFFAQ
ncbi:alpha/beta hydrolase-fold protein [Agarivorans sp. TSD2052]|uniref:alpha/beta hydrolase-fold protein n=1 Tax=Agarivorans sp. TSD2052 TaxID=2937286 RepID=UPI00200D097D|nr:alpha/beta hydrolase-fold protein [Agarivorans sp. TSD2052]UPW19656.1 alpha/beta hydrolase-fold protein [Agarivorans sp. TSD2052]